jgi:sulfate transport system permease protein
MIPFYISTPIIPFSIFRKKMLLLKKIPFILAIALCYGSFILALPISVLLYRAHKYSLYGIIQTLRHPIVLAACEVTFTTALLATTINTIIGLTLAWILVKYEFPGKRILDLGVDLPFALPTSVGGLTLMTVYSQRGWMGPLCSCLGIKIAFTRLGVLVAMIFVSFPFIVRTLQPVIYNMDEEIEEAAWCLGASPWATFWRIHFPNLTSALLTGTSLAFSRAIGEYGSIVLVSSNIPKKDLVISVLIFQRLEQYDHQGAIAIAVLVLCLSFIMLLTINSIQIWRQNLIK